MLQFALAVFVLRTTFGYYLFKFLGDEVEKFLAFTDEGSKLVFGSNYLDHFFVFKVTNFQIAFSCHCDLMFLYSSKAMPTLIFFSSVVNVLYYIGAIQYFIVKLGYLINLLMGTSMTESINTITNIFIGQTGKILNLTRI